MFSRDASSGPIRLRHIDYFDADRELLGQFQQPGRVQAMMGAIALVAADDRGPGDALLLAEVDDGRVQRLAVPAVGAVQVDGDSLAVHFDLHLLLRSFSAKAGRCRGPAGPR